MSYKYRIHRQIARNRLGACAFASALLAFAGPCAATPVPLPDPGITGYNFPEAKETLMGWVNKGDATNIQLHGWGLWTALNMPSGQSEYGMPNVPVYLTWLSPEEIASLPLPAAPTELLTKSLSKRVFKLQVPRQFVHGGQKPKSLSLEAKAASAAAGVVPSDTNVLDTMAYNPGAQAWAQKNQLFSMKALQAIYNAGTGNVRAIPTFPIDAVAIKPTYKIISKEYLLKGSIYKMPAWPGTPSKIDPEGFDEEKWNGCVYVDSKNTGVSAAKGIDAGCASGPNATNTYALGDFVNYPVTAANLHSFSVLTGEKKKLEVGDVILLIAMHVTSREIDEWTWQTYFWTPDPANPPLPSTSAIAKVRPPQLKGAAAHYAMAIGYQMVAPNQPATGGKSVGSPVVVYNPYLEARFGTKVFGTPPVNPGILAPGSGKPYMATVGIQSNCMTCHGSATLSPKNSHISLPYLTNFYVSRDDPAFTGYLQLDFLWSIQDTAK